MKKYVILISFFLVFAVNAQAQSWKDLLGKVANKVTEEVADTDDGIISNVLGSLIGNSVPFSKALIEGTWNYEGSACVLESEDALADIGGSVATAKIEEKLDEYLAKAGVKEGACAFTFMENDSCFLTVNGRDIRGKYELDTEEKIINFSFLRDKLKMKSYLSYNVTDINVVFEADKLLNLIKNVTSGVSEKTSALSALSSSASTKLSTAGAALNSVSTMLENYDGMRLGLKLKK